MKGYSKFSTDKSLLRRLPQAKSAPAATGAICATDSNEQSAAKAAAQQAKTHPKSSTPETSSHTLSMLAHFRRSIAAEVRRRISFWLSYRSNPPPHLGG